MVKYHKIFLVGTRKKITSINFPGGEKTEKWAIFWPPLHKSKLIFHAHAVDMPFFYEFTNLKFKQIAMTM